MHTKQQQQSQIFHMEPIDQQTYPFDTTAADNSEDTTDFAATMRMANRARSAAPSSSTEVVVGNYSRGTNNNSNTHDDSIILDDVMSMGMYRRKHTPPKHKRRYCRAAGCNRIVKSQGVCQRHGAKPKKCLVEDCAKQAQGNFGGMCSEYMKKHDIGGFLVVGSVHPDFLNVLSHPYVIWVLSMPLLFFFSLELCYKMRRPQKQPAQQPRQQFDSTETDEPGQAVSPPLLPPLVASMHTTTTMDYPPFMSEDVQSTWRRSSTSDNDNQNISNHDHSYERVQEWDDSRHDRLEEEQKLASRIKDDDDVAFVNDDDQPLNIWDCPTHHAIDVSCLERLAAELEGNEIGFAETPTTTTAAAATAVKPLTSHSAATNRKKP